MGSSWFATERRWVDTHNSVLLCALRCADLVDLLFALSIVLVSQCRYAVHHVLPRVYTEHVMMLCVTVIHIPRHPLLCEPYIWWNGYNTVLWSRVRFCV